MYTLPTYFILPLTGVNYKDFGLLTSTKYNLRNTKINLQKGYIECEVISHLKVPDKIFRAKSYINYRKDNPCLFLLKLPSKLVKTIEAFVNGKYSKIPPNIKRYLKNHSGLPENHNFLLALDKHQKLRDLLEFELQVRINEDAELLSSPEEEWFIKEEERV